ncbi:MAG: pellicle/biofilm biosynthesis outer membrane protein PelC [Betaproteobacteria bacterium]|nr:MAG: pellicle/biofilm biosynthesis outer membrane protein PelC [Betaproteobacteria bacterium]
MNESKRRRQSAMAGIKTLLFAGALAALAACSTIDVAPRAELDRNARWAVLPLANHTETPQAGARAAAIVEGVLRTRGIGDLVRAPGNLGAETLFEPQDAQAIDKALAWARGAGIRYAVTGSVSEWRYKVGVDGEPAVGLTLQVIEVASGKVMWTATGGRSGWSREALSAVAQKLVRDLTQPLAR